MKLDARPSASLVQILKKAVLVQ